MERELDGLDMQLLRAVSEAGQFVPKNIHQQRRLDRLDLEGYVESERHSVAGADPHPTWIYRLKRKGQRAIERFRA